MFKWLGDVLTRGNWYWGTEPTRKKTSKKKKKSKKKKSPNWGIYGGTYFDWGMYDGPDGGGDGGGGE